MSGRKMGKRIKVNGGKRVDNTNFKELFEKQHGAGQWENLKKDFKEKTSGMVPNEEAELSPYFIIFVLGATNTIDPNSHFNKEYKH